MAPPEFYDIRGCVAWSHEAVTLLTGRRHKLHIVQDPGFAQESPFGLSLENGTIQPALIAVRFGGSYALAPQPTPFPQGSTDGVLTWELGLNWVCGLRVARIGGSVGFGGSILSVAVFCPGWERGQTVARDCSKEANNERQKHTNTNKPIDVNLNSE